MMATEKWLIDANGKYTINAVDLTGFILCFSDGIISVVDRFGHVACEFYADDIPAVDAVEVVHGRWLERYHDHPLGGYSLFHCSKCDTPNARERKFCPECGTKMEVIKNAEN